VDTPIEINTKLLPDQGEDFDNLGKYQILVEKLNYLTLIRPDIAFVLSVISQFLSAPKTSHWNAIVQILRFLQKAPWK